MATKRPRGKCPYCGRRKALTNAGRIWAHKQPDGKTLCGGTGQRPTA